MAILQKWLGSDAPTRTYGHLIECLRKSELRALAEHIANAIEGIPTCNMHETIILMRAAFKATYIWLIEILED